MSTWIKAPNGQRFLLEDVQAYSPSDSQISIQLRGGGMVILQLTPPMAVEGQPYVAPGLAYAELLDKELARLTHREREARGDASGFARGLINWAAERERAAPSPGEAMLFRQVAAEVLLRLSEQANAQAPVSA